MNQDPVQVEAIARQIIDLRTTDMLVLTLPPTLDSAAALRLRRELSELVPVEHRDRIVVVVLTHGMGLNALTDVQLAQIGYRRMSQ